MFSRWLTVVVCALIGIGLAVVAGCSEENQESVTAQKRHEWEQQYQTMLKDLEDNHMMRQFQPTYLDSLRFIKTICLDQDFADDSAHADTLVCLSQSYHTQQYWTTLRKLDLSEYNNWQWEAPKLIAAIQKEMQPNGCLFGNIEPTAAQLKAIQDTCWLYFLRDTHQRILEYAQSGAVDGLVEFLFEQADSIPGLLTWLGTTSSDLLGVRHQGYLAGATTNLKTAYAESGINNVNYMYMKESNRCRQALGWSIEELAQQADVPITWVRWAFQKRGLLPDTAQ